MSNSTEPLVAIVVDGYSAGNFLPAAYRTLGVDLVHVQSTPELYATMKAPDLTVYRENIVLRDSQVTDELLERLRAYSPVCVVPGQETGVELADELSERLGVVSNGTKLSLARRDKFEMVEALRSAGVPCVQHRKGSDPEELLRWVDETVGYPAVVKPLKSAGTDGVVICANREELGRSIRELLGSPNLFGEPNDEVLIQEFLAGPEYIVDTVSSAGYHYACGVWKYQKNLLPSGKNIYDRDVLVDPQDPAAQVMIPYIAKVLDALEIQWGPAHAEVIITERGPVLVEIGARINGNNHPGLQEICLGHSQAGLSAEAYVQAKQFLDKTEGRNYQKRQSALVYNAATALNGVVTAVNQDIAEQIRELPSVCAMTVKYQAGDRIEPTTDLMNAPLRAFLTHPDEAVLEQDYREAKRLAEILYQVDDAGDTDLLAGDFAAEKEFDHA